MGSGRSNSRYFRSITTLNYDSLVLFEWRCDRQSRLMTSWICPLSPCFTWMSITHQHSFCYARYKARRISFKWENCASIILNVYHSANGCLQSKLMTQWIASKDRFDFNVTCLQQFKHHSSYYVGIPQGNPKAIILIGWHCWVSINCRSLSNFQVS